MDENEWEAVRLLAIKKEELKRRIEDGDSLKEIAHDIGVSIGYLSRLCNKYKIKAPKPGRKKGVALPEEHKQKIGESIRNRGH